MAKRREKKKGILDRAIDAVSSRDEEAAAEEAKKAAEAAKRQAQLETAKREAAEAKIRAAEAKAKEAEEKLKAAEKAAAEAKAKERKQRMAEAETRRAERREELQRRAEEGKPKVYVVKSGDSLSKIAKEVLGDAGRWPEIFEANKDQIKDPNLIHVGQELKMPS
jgi:nucleoid-associated protein YgaU